MRTHLIYIILFFSGLIAQCQQFSVPSQPGRNMLYINPAYTGFYETTVASLMNRSSVMGFDGNLSFQNVEIHAPLKKQSIALGFQAFHQQYGTTQSTEFFFDYCHRISMGTSRLAFALKVGGLSKSLGQLFMQDESDPVKEANSITLPNFGFGLAFYSKNFYTGISIPYLLGTAVSSDLSAEITTPDSSVYNCIISAGGKIALNENLKLESHGLFYYSVTKPYSAYEAILNLNLYDRLIIGGGYRSEKAVVVNLGYYLNRQISFLYSYDYGFGKRTVSYSSGSHEISLLYYLGYKINMESARDF